MEKLEIIPKGTNAKPPFNSYEGYRKYCEKVYNRIRPNLERHRRARARSEAKAMGLDLDRMLV